MAIAQQPMQPPVRWDRAGWPAATALVVGAPGGPYRAARCRDRLLGRSLAWPLWSRAATSTSSRATRTTSRRARLPVRDARLAGRLGVFNDVFRQIAGRPSRPVELEETSGLARYFRYSLDHKVSGSSTSSGWSAISARRACSAMAIRTELLSPTTHVFGPGDLHRDRRRARHDDDDC